MNRTVPSYLLELNDVQRQAVEHEGSPLLILAGAGSGKTRVITTKIAYLIDQKGIDPASVLAVTFTNKAAREMKDRVMNLVPDASRTLIRTFHSFGAWLLRRNSGALSLNRNFSIYDDEDMITLLHTIFGKKKRNDLKPYARYISLAKDYALGPEDDLLQISPDPQFPEIYKAYEDKIRTLGNTDFGDLILRPVELLDNFSEIRQRLHQRFRVILVDEYQDSNVAQFELLKRLYGEETYLCVVGDDDQSIYKFRGAEVKNILQFPEIFDGTTIVRLEENYRSTQYILSVASAVVANNSGRLGKKLWTRKLEGNKVTVRFFETQEQEVEYCAGQLTPDTFGKTAILYRTNAQSRAFEIYFSRHNIPYRLVGTLSFYNREEIKDALSLLTLFVNRHDELAFRRVINKPARGIGSSSLNKILSYLPRSGGDTIEACKYAEADLSGKAAKGVSGFLRIIARLEATVETLPLGGFVHRVVNESGLFDYHMNQDKVSNTQKTKNLEELSGAAGEFPNGKEGLIEFLETIELDRASIDQNQVSDEERVTLITMHNTKGLEFDRVFITGLEEGIFPGYQNDQEEDVEEERRIFYVSLTRAKEELYLTSCRTRKIWGRTIRLTPSRFLDEIPTDLIDIEIPEPEDDSDFRVGTAVYHDEYGTGMVCKRWNNGSQISVLVRFESGAVHRFIPKYSTLEKIME